MNLCSVRQVIREFKLITHRLLQIPYKILSFRKKLIKQYRRRWDDPEEVQAMRSILIKDTTKEEREEIIRSSLDCGAGSCENCSSCWLGGGNPWEIYQDYIDGKREIREINMEYNERYLHGRQIKG
jgi:hypothetical protein